MVISLHKCSDTISIWWFSNKRQITWHGVFEVVVTGEPVSIIQKPFEKIAVVREATHGGAFELCSYIYSSTVLLISFALVLANWLVYIRRSASSVVLLRLAVRNYFVSPTRGKGNPRYPCPVRAWSSRSWASNLHVDRVVEITVCLHDVWKYGLFFVCVPHFTRESTFTMSIFNFVAKVQQFVVVQIAKFMAFKTVIWTSWWNATLENW